MSTSEQLFEEYVQLRHNGFDAPSALQQMRLRIELLPSFDRVVIVKRVKDWEAQHKPGAAPASVKPVAPKPVQPQKTPPQSPFNAPIPPPAPVVPVVREAPKDITQTVDKVESSKQVACPNCGKLNAEREVLCYSCGFVLQQQTSPFATVPLNGDTGARDESYFGPESVLILQLRGSSKTYRVEPQKQDHEIVIGRSDGSAMRPDIDLADEGAGQLGVSRLHVGIRYSRKHNNISISDMNSANGTFVNGQKVYPQEVRVLRHNDEIRLGKMVFQAQFQ